MGCRPTDIKPSYIDSTCTVVMCHNTMHISLSPVPEDQVFQSVDLSLNCRSLAHPAHLCCCWAQGPLLGTLIGIYSATRQQGPQVAAPKAVIKSLLWVLWAGACLLRAAFHQDSLPYLCRLLHSVTDAFQAPLLSATVPPSACHPVPSTPSLAGLPHSAQMSQGTTVSAGFERSGEIDASMFSCYPGDFWNKLGQ